MKLAPAAAGAWLATGLLLAAGCDAPLRIGAVLPGPDAATGDDAPPVAVDAPAIPDARPALPDTAGPEARPRDAAPPDAADRADTPACRADAASGAPALLDIIILLDNSSSMEARMPAILRRLSADLPRVMNAAAIDWRVLLISRYGQVGTHLGDSYTPVCVSAPLSAADCASPNTTPLVNNAPTFFHFSAYVDSNNALCRLLEIWNKPDEIPAGERAWTTLFPNGIASTLRPAAPKAILVISDDEAVCQRGTFTSDYGDDPAAVAQRLRQALGALAPAQFGAATDPPRFTIFSLVGLTAAAGQVLAPGAPISGSVCSGADQPGVIYQGLSVATGGARQSICDVSNLDPLFQAMTATAAPAACP